MEGSRVASAIMNKRCAGCKIEEKLRNLQVLRHIMLTREKGCGAIEKERCTAHDNEIRKRTNLKSVEKVSQVRRQQGGYDVD